MDRRIAGFVLGLVCLAGVASGCGPAVHNITVRSEASVAPDPTMATIVVMQPSSRYGSVSILDQNGDLVGMVSDRSSTLVRVPAGAFRLYALVEREAGWGDRLEGTVEAGHIYYATISMRWGGINFLALTPHSRDDRWSHLTEYLENAPMVQMDPARVDLAVQELGDTAPLIARMDDRADGLDAEHHEEHVLAPADGQ
ncbi:MAG: hypothetical protein U0234_25325 [Sandaracinus sp.]